MTEDSLKRLVLDANILVRAIFGVRVGILLEKYAGEVEFYTPDHCVSEARENIPGIARIRGIAPTEAESLLDRLVQNFLQVTDRSLYDAFEQQARERISDRDVDDWPVVATALLLRAPIWTEDKDYLGCGVATWTTGKVEIYLRSN
ncbi:MAG TPA: PIN domain-containing protein [Terracidiphilus sp.]|nr:PIN domain-containing protein [Terracidiphilus sp.]